MLELLGLAWSAWKLSAKRLGPVGGLVFAGAAVAGFVVLRNWLAESHPELNEELEKVV